MSNINIIELYNKLEREYQDGIISEIDILKSRDSALNTLGLLFLFTRTRVENFFYYADRKV